MNQWTMEVFMLIQKNKGIGVSELVIRTGTHQSNVSAVLKKLLAAKVITRSKDGRKTLYAVNPFGIDRINQSLDILVPTMQ